ncbi:hypothetical protein M427DRAFT_63290 [Gonapodya prolifera JEL478]|uniref:Uncharacterized protein n=1 Tax=Gonapodya prolifera (strain JEL478) TaxID=1344416 RepID=A0A139A068_GONPJ|nr:hypothetical protein M427DRAFT_63290 [Gonapodya prolifera JEL478]|eukprot:KXS09935.1 hypothetical protein M427DRAFT_63290 [Gonapodya prolifera JEL478]
MALTLLESLLDYILMAPSNPVVGYLFPSSDGRGRNTFLEWIAMAKWAVSIAITLFAIISLTRFATQSYWKYLRRVMKWIFVIVAFLVLAIVFARWTGLGPFGEARDFTQEELQLLL